MKQRIFDRVTRLVAVFLLGSGVLVGAGYLTAASAADIEETPAADLRQSQRAVRVCTDGCASDCRSERTSCANGQENTDRCRAQFQICVRRCVVSCGSN
jgi:hypothetical protein